MKLQIGLTSARGRSDTLTAERLINCFAEKAPEGAEAPAVVHGAPGLVTFADTNGGACRGLLNVSGVLYAVCGASLFRIDSAGTVSASLGTVPGTSLVSMATDGDILVIVTNPAAYTYTVSTGAFAQITDAAYGGAHSVIWMNQTFVFASATEHFVGDTGGLLPFDPLLAASAEYAPDAIVGIARDHNELLIYGETTLESWNSVAVQTATDYPFEAISGAIAEKGLAGRRAIVQLDNTTIWLDQHGIVRRLAGGYSPQRISTEAIEHQLATATLADVEMLVYVIEGHECFAINSDVGTFVYDANTGLWHERQSLGEDRWKAQCSAYVYGRWLVGSKDDGVISRLDLDTHNENGAELVAQMVFPPIAFGRDRFTIHRLEVGCDTGVGTLTVDPIIRLRMSRDGTHWGAAQSRGLGLAGERAKSVYWTKLGQWSKCHIRLDIADPYRRAIYAAYADITRDDR